MAIVQRSLHDHYSSIIIIIILIITIMIIIIIVITLSHNANQTLTAQCEQRTGSST